MFIAYDVSLQLIAELRVVLPSVRRADKNLADQITRAATSVALNLGEGRERRGGDQRRFFEIAPSAVRRPLQPSAVRRCRPPPPGRSIPG